MQISMQNAEGLNGQQIEEFLKGSEGIGFSGESRAGSYKWVERLLVAQEFAVQGKKRRGMIRRYASRITGLRGGGFVRGCALRCAQCQTRSGKESG